MRLRNFTYLLLLLAACVAVGCGADKETKPSIPAAASTDFMTRLTSVENRFKVGDGACNDIPQDQVLVNDQIAKLPSSVGSDVRNALQDSFDHLFDLTSAQCDKTKGQSDTPPNTTPTTPPTDTTNSDTTPTDNTNTDTTPTDTTPPDTTTTPGTPPNQGNPGGQGGDNQGGGGAQGPGD